MGAVARAALAGCCLFALAACSGDVEDTAPRTTATAPSTTPSTTAAPSTTSAPTTTLSPQQQDEADIRALHDRFFRMLVVTGRPSEPRPSRDRGDDHWPPAAAVGQIRSHDGELRRAHRWHRSTGTDADRSIFRDRDHAAVLDVHTAATSLLNADGIVVVRTTGPTRRHRAAARASTDGWRVEDWLTGGDGPCEAVRSRTASSDRRWWLRAHAGGSGTAVHRPASAPAAMPPLGREGSKSTLGLTGGRRAVGPSSPSSEGRGTIRARTARCRLTGCWHGTSRTRTRATTTLRSLPPTSTTATIPTHGGRWPTVPPTPVGTCSSGGRSVGVRPPR